MGCHQCTSNRRPGWETGKKKISFIAPTLHYSLNFVPQSAYLNNLDSEDIKALYKTVLSPFQLKMVSCSNLKSLDTTLSSESKENSFESVPPDFQAELISAAQIWPLDISNSIFVFVNAGKNIKIKTLMTGFEKTPYANGLFEFDINFQNSSLAQIQVEFITATRNNHVFFGHKLNKLKGVEAKETWLQDTSLSEILTKLHNLVKMDTYWEEELDPDFLGLDDQQKQRLNRGRKNIVKCNTIQYAMLDQIKTPVPWLRDVIHTYFYLKKDIILKECRKWLLAAQTDDAIYENLSDFGEKEFIAEFENGGYFRKLSSLIKELETEISRIKIHIDSPVLEALGQTDKEVESERESPRSFGNEIDLELDSSQFKILPQL